MRRVPDKGLTFKTQWDLWKAEIGSILKYGLSTTRQTQIMEIRLQIGDGKCLRTILDKEEDGQKGNIESEKLDQGLIKDLQPYTNHALYSKP